MINDPALAIDELKSATAAPGNIGVLDVGVIVTLLSAISDDALGNEMVRMCMIAMGGGGGGGY